MVTTVEANIRNTVVQGCALGHQTVKSMQIHEYPARHFESPANRKDVRASWTTVATLNDCCELNFETSRAPPTADSLAGI